MRALLEGVVVQPSAIHEPPHELAILEQVDRLERIAWIEWVERIRTIIPLTKIEEARHLRDRVVDRVAGVVITEQPTIVRVSHDFRTDIERRLRTQVLGQVEAHALLVREGVLDDAVVSLEKRRHEVLRVLTAATHVDRRLVVERLLTEDQVFVAEVVVGIVRRCPERVAERVAEIEGGLGRREAREGPRALLRREAAVLKLERMENSDAPARPRLVVIMMTPPDAF